METRSRPILNTCLVTGTVGDRRFRKRKMWPDRFSARVKLHQTPSASGQPSYPSSIVIDTLRRKPLFVRLALEKSTMISLLLEFLNSFLLVLLREYEVFEAD